MRGQDAGGSAWAAFAVSAWIIGAPAVATAADVSVRFTLDRAIDGLAAPFLLALDKGYYKSEGLNVGFDAADSLIEPITRVASGLHEMGLADINALIKFRDANPKAPVKAVFILHNQPAYAVIARRSRGIATPRDLEGKRLGAPVADGAFAHWPIFVQANNIDAGKVTIDNLGASVREPMLAAGQVDAITGLTYGALLNLKHRGVPAGDLVALRMADYGVDLYGQAIIVNTVFAAEQPAAVRAFLRAFVKALKETVRSPTTGIEAVRRRDDGAKPDLELERLTMVIRENIVTPEVRMNGYGGIDQARFVRALDQIALAHKFREAKPKPNEIFDGSYLPPAESRKVQ